MQVRTLQGHVVEDLTTYPTRAEVAEELGVSVSRIRTLERRGKLHPIVDSEGSHRFHPAEVQAFAMIDGDGSPELADEETRKGAYAGIDLVASQRLLNLTIVPREKADRFVTEVMDRQAARVRELEAQLSKMWDMREAAADRTAERTMALESARAVEVRTDQLMTRGLANLERFALAFLGGKGAPPSVPAAGKGLRLEGLIREQLQAILEVRDMWTGPQLAAIEAALNALPPETTETTEPKENPK